MHAAVRAVEHHPSFLRIPYFLEYLLLLRPHDAVLVAVQAVGDNVAGLEEPENLRHRQQGVGDVDHKRHLGQVCGLPGQA